MWSQSKITQACDKLVVNPETGETGSCVDKKNRRSLVKCLSHPMNTKTHLTLQSNQSIQTT
jgi:hypothetical protein